MAMLLFAADATCTVTQMGRFGWMYVRLQTWFPFEI